MKLNDYTVQILRSLLSIGNRVIDRQLIETGDSIMLRLNNRDLVEINKDSVILNGEDIGNRIFNADNRNGGFIEMNKISNFISSIAHQIVKINHLGISYACGDIRKELIFYKKLIAGTTLKLYEEKSDSELSRWFFIGNPENDNSPLFEIVLAESLIPIANDWIPHFQIDIDTALEYEDILKVTKSFLADNFIGWSLDIPNYGIVLCMGVLGNIDGTKITLGIGTNLRKKQTLKEIG